MDKNMLFFPLRVVLPQEKLATLKLLTLAQERALFVKPRIKGNYLDVGCGENLLAKPRKNSIGVDVFPWPNIDCLVQTQHLPFQDNSFDTTSLMACLNHIPLPIRHQVLTEIHRVTKPNGRIIVTMINPLIGWVCHRLIAHWDTDQTTRGIKIGEQWGMSDDEVTHSLKKAGFNLIHRQTFSFFKLNTLFIFRKAKT